MAKKRVVLDTNIFISAYIFPGSTVSELFERIIAGDFVLGVSEDIILEFTRVIMHKFKLSAGMAREYTDMIRTNAVIVKPAGRVSIIKDPSDNRIIECVAEFKADYIISGGRHLLDLKKYKKTKIIPPAAFARLFF